MTEIEKFDPSTLAEKVRDRIRNSIADLIPDDAWSTLIKKEVDVFFAPKQETSHNKYQPSTISELVRRELHDEIKIRLKEFFQSAEWKEQWTNDLGGGGNGRYAASEAMKKIVLENSTAIISAILADGMQSVLMSMRDRFR